MYASNSSLLVSGLWSLFPRPLVLFAAGVDWSDRKPVFWILSAGRRGADEESAGVIGSAAGKGRRGLTFYSVPDKWSQAQKGSVSFLRGGLLPIAIAPAGTSGLPVLSVVQGLIILNPASWAGQ